VDSLISWLPIATRFLFVASITLGAGSIYKGYKLYHQDRTDKKITPVRSLFPRQEAQISDNLLSSQLDGAERAKIIRHSLTAPEESRFMSVDLRGRKTASDTKVENEEVPIG
jgi:hypothetical protein